MLFALSFDKFFFGHTPDLLSIAGSTLILGSAIYIALMANAGNNSAAGDTANPTIARTEDELEAQQGLMSGLRGGERDVESGEDHDRLPIQEIQLRTLR